jgi:hypothetical protein
VGIEEGIELYPLMMAETAPGILAGLPRWRVRFASEALILAPMDLAQQECRVAPLHFPEWMNRFHDLLRATGANGFVHGCDIGWLEYECTRPEWYSSWMLGTKALCDVLDRSRE